MVMVWAAPGGWAKRTCTACAASPDSSKRVVRLSAICTPPLEDATVETTMRRGIRALKACPARTRERSVPLIDR
jgi:hypothetical protein